ncbi:MAG: hypothetical protein ACOX2F_02650 [bacterium]
MTMKKTSIISMLLAGFIVFSTCPVEAVAGKVGRTLIKKAAKEGIEEGAKKSLKSVAKQVGKKNANAILKKAGTEGLEFAAKHGDRGARLVLRHGKKGVRLAKTYGPEKVFELTQKHGDNAVEAMLRHPGSGFKIVEELGEPGIRIAKNHSTATVNKTLKHLPEATKLGIRDKYIRVVEKEGAGFFERAGKYVLDNPVKSLALGGALWLAVDPESFSERINKGIMPVVDKGVETAGKTVVVAGESVGKGVGAVVKEVVPSWFLTLLFVFLAAFLTFKLRHVLAFAGSAIKKVFRVKSDTKTKNGGVGR